MNFHKPRIWLLALIPVLLVGLFLLGEEIPKSRDLGIVLGVVFFLLVYALLYVWITAYEALVAWKEARGRATLPDDLEIELMAYSGENPFLGQPTAVPSVQVFHRVEEPAGHLDKPFGASFRIQEDMSPKERMN